MSTFSERYKYIKENQIPYDKMSNSLKNRIWNSIFLLLKDDLLLTKGVIENFLKLNSYKLEKDYIEVISEKYETLVFHEVYSLIEFILDSKKNLNNFKKDINKIFIEEKAQYRITEKQVVKLISAHEMQEIDKIFEIDDIFLKVRENIFKGLDFYLKNLNKESIQSSLKAVEELCKIILKTEDTLNELIENLKINKNYKLLFKNLAPTNSYEEARFLLVSCSAFVNYLISIYF